MTKPDYYDDAYATRFEARVTGTREGNGVVLDRTSFYPGGGGQPHDIGTLAWNGHRVSVDRVSREGEDIVHWLAGPPPDSGTSVTGEVEWDRRFALMRTHTALHILCGVIWERYQALSTGCGMQPGRAHIDFELESVTPEMLVELEEAMNGEVAAARRVSTRTVDRAEAEATPALIKTKVNLLPSHLTRIRVVDIEGLDAQADGGTHVANTSEVGTVRIVRYKSKGRQNKRLYVELDDGASSST